MTCTIVLVVYCIKAYSASVLQKFPCVNVYLKFVTYNEQVDILFSQGSAIKIIHWCERKSWSTGVKFSVKAFLEQETTYLYCVYVCKDYIYRPSVFYRRI